MQSTGLLRAGALLYARDLKLAFRRWEQVTQPVVFFLMVTTLFPLALSPDTAQLRQVAAGILWVAALTSDSHHNGCPESTSCSSVPSS